MRKPSYIKPPSGDKLTWFKGPPPEVGWWPASKHRWSDVLRWWDGTQWSIEVLDMWVADDAGRRASKKAPLKDQERIQWTRRWWEAA